MKPISIQQPTAQQPANKPFAATILFNAAEGVDAEHALEVACEKLENFDPSIRVEDSLVEECDDMFNKMQRFLNEYKDLCLKHNFRLAVDMTFKISVIPLRSYEMLKLHIEGIEHNSDLPSLDDGHGAGTGDI